MKTVLLMGAGASRDAGGPLMSDFLDRAEALGRRGGLGDKQKAFEDVFRAQADLRGVFAKSHLDLDNIESMFGAIEMGRVIGKFGGRDEASIAELSTSMTSLIVHTLEREIKFPVVEGTIFPPGPYDHIGETLRDLRHHNRLADVTFATFNYDLCLDFALFQGGGVDYCLEGYRTDGANRLLKLHGSINWGRCQKCKKIVPYEVGRARFDLFRKSNVLFNLGSTIDSQKHCNMPLRGPIVVPPTWSKTEWHQQLSHVWRRACQELEQAQNIVVAGYSLPSSDEFFRYLFALGSDSPAKIRRFIVIDPDPKVEDRFKEILARSVRERRFEFHQKTLSEAIEVIDEVLETR